MTLEVPLTGEQEMYLRDQARLAGMTLVDYTVRRLLGNGEPDTGTALTDDEWQAVASEFGSEIAPNTPSMSPSALSRESIYSERL